MEQKNRKTLKSYFEKGDVPTEEQFAELIDSVSNIVDDGQVIRTGNGWLLSSAGREARHRPSYGYREPAAWKLSVTPEKRLAFKTEKMETILCLRQDKNVTLYGSLHIEGGETPVPSGDDYLVFPANKQWYDLPVDISHEGFGCRVYSIHASFREQGTGLCRLTRATAIWLNIWTSASNRRRSTGGDDPAISVCAGCNRKRNSTCKYVPTSGSHPENCTVGLWRCTKDKTNESSGTRELWMKKDTISSSWKKAKVYSDYGSKCWMTYNGYQEWCEWNL